MHQNVSFLQFQWNREAKKLDDSRIKRETFYDGGSPLADVTHR